jgi:hypothetical protein
MCATKPTRKGKAHYDTCKEEQCNSLLTIFLNTIIIIIIISLFLTTDWRNGLNTRLLRKRSRVRLPHSTNICVHEYVCLYCVWTFSILCMYLQKKKYINMYIYPLSRIHNTSFVSAYFGLDKRGCE